MFNSDNSTQNPAQSRVFYCLNLTSDHIPDAKKMALKFRLYFAVSLFFICANIPTMKRKKRHNSRTNVALITPQPVYLFYGGDLQIWNISTLKKPQHTPEFLPQN